MIGTPRPFLERTVMADVTPTPESPVVAAEARRRRSRFGTVVAGFRDFIARGNVIELAVAVAIGAAFAAVVTALTNGLLGPLVAMALRGQDLSKSWTWNWLGSEFSLGVVIDALLKFVITAVAIYFLVVLPMNAWNRRRAAGVEPEPEAPAEDVELLREIRDLLAAPKAPPV